MTVGGYMGPREASAAVGKWLSIVGNDCGSHERGEAGRELIGAWFDERWRHPQYERWRHPQYQGYGQQQYGNVQPNYWGGSPPRPHYWGGNVPRYQQPGYPQYGQNVPHYTVQAQPQQGSGGGVLSSVEHGLSSIEHGLSSILGVPHAGPGIRPRNLLVEDPGPDRAGREVLPMSTGVAILPTQSAQITARPQRVAFRPERVFISAAGTSGGAADWVVNDIKIGNRSQFSQSGDVPGDMFATNAIDGFVSFETAQTAMDVVMVVTYIGLNESGVPFFASIVGTAAI